MSTRQTFSFCLCCFWQVMRHLWSLHVSRIHRNTDLHSSSNVYPTSWFILSVFFLQGGGTSVAPTCVRDPRDMNLHPGRKVYLTSWFILSVLFLTGGETSVVPTCVRNPPSHRFPPHRNVNPKKLVHSVCVVSDRWWDICGPYTCPRSTVMGTYTPVAMSTQPAGSFCLCSFWQVVRHLWYLHMSGIHHHMDLHPDRNIYLTSWFILSVFLLTGGETSLVSTCVWNPLSHRPPPW